MHEIIIDYTKIYIVMEYCPRGNLYEFIKTEGFPICEGKIITIMD